MKLRRRMRINVRGKKLYKFINMLHDSGIGCRRQFCKGEMFCGDIFRRDLKAVTAIAEDCGAELKAAEYESFGAKIFLYRKRFGLFIGAVGAAAALFWSSQSVAVIDIQGNSAVSDEVILAALEAVVFIKHINKLGEGRCYVNTAFILYAFISLTKNFFNDHSIFFNVRIIFS